ncbi:MAG TPA: hypothetical protein DDZ80_14110 [Cyanobacteria bacterium UBA8803]|nr:hypothetical protein [Cyanobacteria bacterium UBA9273]HBL59574.1 hypothetical protein [Cyanobacteria bacterium UBA8803]
MFQIVKQIVLRLQSETLKLLILAGVLLLAWGIVAPVGTLVWWLSQSAESLGLKENRSKNLPSSDRSPNTANTSKINCYIVFLPGVGDFSANQLTPGEEFFLDRLVKLHPNCVAVSDVFPYSAANKSLGGQRFLAPVWRAAEAADGWLENADVLIKIRNLWRFAISADDRYGPIYNQGIADAILERMNAAHPIPQFGDRSLKIILLGTSGGVQVALGAVPDLDRWLNAKLIVVSVGGDFEGTTGFNEVDRVYHLQGSRDWIEDLSKIIFPSRWPWTVGSPFNQARREGRYLVLPSGPHTHDGDQGYFGEELVGKSHTTYVELTLQQVNQLPIW